MAHNVLVGHLRFPRSSRRRASSGVLGLAVTASDEHISEMLFALSPTRVGPPAKTRRTSGL